MLNDNVITYDDIPAEIIETYFHSKGMLNTDDKGGYDKENSKYVYVYKKHPTILD